MLHELDWFVSIVGITRQKDVLTYMDVDYLANVNLVNKAKSQASSSASSSGVTFCMYLQLDMINQDNK